MQESYEEMMLPLFLRLGGKPDELYMDNIVDSAVTEVKASSVSAEKPAPYKRRRSAP